MFFQCFILTRGYALFVIKFITSAIFAISSIDKIIEVADPDTQDYLWTIRDTMARVGEINRLTWDEVVLNGVYEVSYVILKSRKTKGGNLTPRRVYMTRTLFDILSNRFERRDIAKPWVFWHRYWDKKEKNL